MFSANSVSGGGLNSLIKWGKFLVVAALLLASGFFIPSVRAEILNINLTHPVGGEFLRGVANITWTSDGIPSDTVEISYSTNNFDLDTKVIIANVPNTGTYPWNTAGVPDGGNYKIQVKSATTSANSRSPSSFTVDNTAPTFVVNNSVEVGPVQSDTIRVTVDGAISGTVATEYGFSPDSTCDASDTFGNSFTSGADFTIAGDHTDYLCAKATDLAGNIGYQLIGQLNTDNTTPTIPVANIVGTTIQAANDTVIIMFSEPVVAADGTWSINEFTSIIGSVTGPLTLTNALFNYSSNALTITLNEATDHMFLRNGETITVNPVTDAIKDIAGNSLANTAVVGTIQVNGDMVAPTVALTYNPNRPVRDVNTVTITATFSETLNGVPNIAIDTTGVDVSATPMTSTPNPLVWTYTWDVPAGSDGTATVAITANDLAGNGNAPATNNTRTIDNTPPTISSYTLDGVLASAFFNPTAPDSVIIILNANEPVKFNTIRILNSGNTEVKNFTQTGSFEISTTKTWSGKNASEVVVPDGEYRLKPKIVDEAGNETDVVIVPHTITVDTINPTISAFNAPVADAVYKTNTPLQFTPNDSATAVTCAYKIDSGSYVPIVCTVATPFSNTIPDGSLSDGRHTVTVKVTDAASNYLESSPVSFVFDNNNTLTVDDTPGNNPDFSTISEAITKSTANDTISMAAGSYTESLTINKSLTLQGAESSSTTITGAQTVTASNVIVDGFTLNGGITLNDAANSISGGTISHNFITGAQYGIRIGSTATGFGVNNVTIDGNTITANTKRGILFYNRADYVAQGVSNVTINDNKITNNTDGGVNGGGISTYGPGPNTITNNTITGNNGNGISIKYDNGDVVTENIVTGNAAMGINMHQVTNSTVENNTVSGHVSEAVVTTFWGGSITAGKGSAIYIHENSHDNTIRLNTLINNKIGVLISRESAGTDPSVNSINDNTITGNTVYGILNALVAPSVPANAESNWYGEVSGPLQASTNPLGAGNAVTNDVDYSPWCTNIGCTTFGSSDPIDHFSITPSAGSSVVNVPLTLTVTAKDVANITRVNDTSVVSMAADHGASLGTLLLTLAGGTNTTTVNNSVTGTVNVSGIKVGGTATGSTSISFTNSDVAPPTIVSHSPADNATGVAVTVTPYIVFSESLKASTVNSTNIQLVNYNTDVAVPAVVSLVEGGTRVNITPDSSLANNTQYYFAVSTGVQDEIGNALTAVLDSSTKDSNEFTTVAIQPIVIDEVVVQSNTATPTDSYLNGWHYTFRITINDGLTHLRVKFADWVNSTNPALKVLANGNMRLLFNTSTGNGLGSIVGLTDTDIVNGITPISSFAIGNEYTDQSPGAIDITGLDISTDSGQQIKFDVFTKLPITTAAGFYETTYGIRTQ